MNRNWTGFKVLAPAALALVSQAAAADVLLTLGEQDFTNGSTPGTADFLTAGGNESAPFDGVFSGADTASNFSTSWTFASYGSQPTILGASLTLGIYDHESAAPGNQVAAFTLNGFDLTSAMSTLFEVPAEITAYLAELDAFIEREMGGGVYGFSSLFEAAKEKKIAAPRTLKQLEKLLDEHLYVEGEVRLDERADVGLV